MSPEELRRIAQEAPSRKESEDKARADAAINDAWERWNNKQWAEARATVQNLEREVRKAAENNQFEMVIYRAHSSISIGTGCYVNGSEVPFSTGHIVEEIYKTKGFFRITKERVGMRILSIPDFAQYVFDHCPANLNPRWMPISWYKNGGVSNGGVSSGTGFTGIELHLSW